MKKIGLLLLVSTMLLGFVGCAKPEEEIVTEETTEATVNLMVLNGEKELVEVEFPVAPKKVAVLNYQTLDFMDSMGLGDRVAGVIKGSLPDHLKHYAENEDIVNLGSMKDIDMEALAALEPEVIFSSDRTVSSYDLFSSIAPTMSCAIVYADGFMNSYKDLAQRHAAVFGLNDEINDIITIYEERVNAINEKFNGSSALLGIFAGGLNTLGNTGRCDIIVNEMGFVNAAGDKDVNHGNKSSYEVFLELNPEFIFIIDKDTAVGTEAISAPEQMENEIIMQTDAYKNDKIIYLEPGACWYLCDGGITAFDLMISDLEKDLGMN